MTATNLKQIGLALWSYYDAHRAFPSAFLSNQAGRPLLSWRVAILPYFHATDLYVRFALDEPWDSDTNRELIAQIPHVYRPRNCIADPGCTPYLTIRGADTVFPGRAGITMEQISDGAAYTVAVVEASEDTAVPWTKPDDLPYDDRAPMDGLSSRAGGFLALFVDGSVHFINTSINPDLSTIRSLFTRNDGTPLDRRKWEHDR